MDFQNFELDFQNFELTVHLLTTTTPQKFEALTPSQAIAKPLLIEKVKMGAKHSGQNGSMLL